MSLGRERIPNRWRQQQRAWYVYDWANSAFSTTVVTLFFGPYLTVLAKEAAGPDGTVALAGLQIHAAALWPFLVSISVLTQILALPLVGSLADHTGKKREFLAALAFAGATATASMYWLQGSRYLLACVLFLIANFCFGASVVVYNAFLPYIAHPWERDAVSSNGWALGYLGGALLLGLNLLLHWRAEAFAWEEEFVVRVSLCSAGLWWAAFSIVPVARLHNPVPTANRFGGEPVWRAGWSQLSATLKRLPSYRQTLLFLLAFFFYNDAIQAVITLAAQFGQEELQLDVRTLALCVLLAQLVAFPGALAFKVVARWIGAKSTVMVTLFIWTGIVAYVYLGVRSATEFYGLSAAVGMVMGASQALSRSLFSLLIPRGEEARYFSLYEITDKGTSWVAPFIFGLALQWTGNFRLAVLSLLFFFAAGLALISRVNVREGAVAAGNPPPSAPTVG